jgi:hypothetical protein
MSLMILIAMYHPTSRITNTMLQDKGESSIIKHQLDDMNSNISSTKPDSASTSDTTISERGETIITMTIRKPLIYKLKGDIMVCYVTKPKSKFYDNASFFSFWNIHQCDSLFHEWGVQNISCGERRPFSRNIICQFTTLFW